MWGTKERWWWDEKDPSMIFEMQESFREEDEKKEREKKIGLVEEDEGSWRWMREKGGGYFVFDLGKRIDILIKRVKW